MNESTSARELEVLSATVEALGGISRFKLAVASGSRAAGLGHGSSDLDVHVVPRDPDDKVPRKPKGAPQEVQVTAESLESVEVLRQLAQSFNPTPDDRGPYLFDNARLWRLMRLVVGTVLLTDDDTEFLSDYDTTNLRRTFVGSFSIVSARALEDAAGMADVMDQTSALDVANHALRAAAEAALAACGDVYAVPKFLIRRLERARPLSNVRQEVVDALLFGNSDLQNRIQTATALAQTLAGWANQTAWGLEPADPTLPSVGRYRRAPGFGLIRYSTSWSLAGVPRSYRLNDQAASTWLEAPSSLDGASLQPLISAGVVIDDGLER